MAINFPSAGFPELQTDRLLLRELKGDDAEQLLKIRNNEEVNRYIGRSSAQTLADVAQFIAGRKADRTEKKGVYWVIELKETGAVIGAICYWNFNQVAQSAEIGYELLPQMQGIGLAHEAVNQVINYGFTAMDLLAINALTLQQNIKSVKLLTRFGFKLNGTEGDELVYILNNTL